VESGGEGIPLSAVDLVGGMMVMMTVVRIGSGCRKDLNISIKWTTAHKWHEMVYGASILEIDEGVRSVGSNKFVG